MKNVFKLLKMRWKESRDYKALINKLEMDNLILRERLEYYIHANIRLHSELLGIAGLRDDMEKIAGRN